MAIAEVKLNGVAADHPPVLHGDTRKLLLRGPANFVADKVALSGVFSTRRCGAQFFHRDELLDSIAPNERDFGSNEFEACRVHGDEFQVSGL